MSSSPPAPPRRACAPGAMGSPGGWPAATPSLPRPLRFHAAPRRSISRRGRRPRSATPRGSSGTPSSGHCAAAASSASWTASSEASTRVALHQRAEDLRRQRAQQVLEPAPALTSPPRRRRHHRPHLHRREPRRSATAARSRPRAPATRTRRSRYPPRCSFASANGPSVMAGTPLPTRTVRVFAGSASASPPTSSPDGLSSAIIASISAISSAPPSPMNAHACRRCRRSASCTSWRDPRAPSSRGWCHPPWSEPSLIRSRFALRFCASLGTSRGSVAPPSRRRSCGWKQVPVGHARSTPRGASGPRGASSTIGPPSPLSITHVRQPGCSRSAATMSRGSAAAAAPPPGARRGRRPPTNGAIHALCSPRNPRLTLAPCPPRSPPRSDQQSHPRPVLGAAAGGRPPPASRRGWRR